MLNAIKSKKAAVPIAACLAAIVMVTGIMGGCLGWFSTTTNEYSIYKSENVEVALMKDNEDIRFTNYEWKPVNDDIAYTKNNLIIVGEATNVRPVIVSYKYMDTDVSDYMTIFDVKVSDLLACSSDFVHSGDVITVGVGYNIGKYGEGLPIIEAGRSYMIFCYTTDTIRNDVMELSNYVDCWISSPKDLFLEKVGDYYLSIDYFSDAPESLALSEKLHLTEEQIETFLGEEMKGEGPVEMTAMSLDKEEVSILQILAERTMLQSSACWNLYCRSYLCPGSALEEYVRNKAFTYYQNSTLR